MKNKENIEIKRQEAENHDANSFSFTDVERIDALILDAANAARIGMAGSERTFGESSAGSERLWRSNEKRAAMESYDLKRKYVKEARILELIDEVSYESAEVSYDVPTLEEYCWRKGHSYRTYDKDVEPGRLRTPDFTLQQPREGTVRIRRWTHRLDCQVMQARLLV